MGDSNDKNTILVSYLTLRRIVGILGILLPVVLVVGDSLMNSHLGIRVSISDYYGTGMRDVFVGLLFVVGWFLLAYRGYSYRDNITGSLAGLFALGVALFPTTCRGVIGTVHFLCAAGLFLMLSYFSLCLFTKTHQHIPPTPEKRVRNRIYTACGIVMLVCIALIALYNVLLEESPVADSKPVFWLELLALWAFGFSWMVKGETLWRDQGDGGRK